MTDKHAPKHIVGNKPQDAQRIGPAIWNLPKDKFYTALQNAPQRKTSHFRSGRFKLRLLQNLPLLLHSDHSLYLI